MKHAACDQVTTWPVGRRITHVAEAVDEASCGCAVVSGMGRSPQHEQTGRPLPLVPRSDPRKAPPSHATARWPGRAEGEHNENAAVLIGTGGGGGDLLSFFSI